MSQSSILDNRGRRVERVVVLGGGESGLGAALLARDRGYRTILSDSGTLLARVRDELTREGIDFEEGGHSATLFGDGRCVVVKSPGIPGTAPVVREALDAGADVVSEIEFAGWHMPPDARTICITGSNGKTTTTMLTHAILTRGGMDPGLAGNVGYSLARQVSRNPRPWYVIELSSFQLDDMHRFRADIAVLLNITPDHLDRYGYCFENYVDAKMRILNNQTPAQSLVYWRGCPVVSRRVEHQDNPRAMLYPFDSAPAPGQAAWVDADGHMHVVTPGRAWTMPADELALKGTHNLYDQMAASLAASLAGVDPDAIKDTLRTFGGVEHRLEHILTHRGVTWINDSKATNVDSTFYALGAMTTPVVLVLGGKDKGNDYSQILPAVKDKVHTVVAMGLHNGKIVDFFKDTVPVIDTHSLDRAVEACARAARPGDTVLLSPCCASFDLFKSYEDRGRRFKQAVRDLAQTTPEPEAAGQS